MKKIVLLATIVITAAHLAKGSETDKSTSAYQFKKRIDTIASYLCDVKVLPNNYKELISHFQDLYNKFEKEFLMNTPEGKTVFDGGKLSLEKWAVFNEKIAELEEETSITNAIDE